VGDTSRSRPTAPSRRRRNRLAFLGPGVVAMTTRASSDAVPSVVSRRTRRTTGVPGREAVVVDQVCQIAMALRPPAMRLLSARDTPRTHWALGARWALAPWPESATPYRGGRFATESVDTFRELVGFGGPSPGRPRGRNRNPRSPAGTRDRHRWTPVARPMRVSVHPSRPEREDFLLFVWLKTLLMAAKTTHPSPPSTSRPSSANCRFCGVTNCRFGCPPRAVKKMTVSR